MSRTLRTKARLLPLVINATFFFFSSASDLIFLSPGLINISTSCSRIAIERARGGIFASDRNTARSASFRSNWPSALALSALRTILSRKREEVALSMVANLAAKRASGPLASPTAKVSVSEYLNQMRPPQTVAIVKIRVSAANSVTCRRLVLRSFGRWRRVSDEGVGASALMAHVRNLKAPSIVGCAGKSPELRPKCLNKYDNFLSAHDIRTAAESNQGAAGNLTGVRALQPQPVVFQSSDGALRARRCHKTVSYSHQK